jgi:hypothetical protein
MGCSVCVFYYDAVTGAWTGVHGMCGDHAAKKALHDVFSIKIKDALKNLNK